MCQSNEEVVVVFVMETAWFRGAFVACLFVSFASCGSARAIARLPSIVSFITEAVPPCFCSLLCPALVTYCTKEFRRMDYACLLPLVHVCRNVPPWWHDL